MWPPSSPFQCSNKPSSSYPHTGFPWPRGSTPHGGQCSLRPFWTSPSETLPLAHHTLIQGLANHNPRAKLVCCISAKAVLLGHSPTHLSPYYLWLLLLYDGRTAHMQWRPSGPQSREHSLGDPSQKKCAKQAPTYCSAWFFFIPEIRFPSHSPLEPSSESVVTVLFHHTKHPNHSKCWIHFCEGISWGHVGPSTVPSSPICYQTELNQPLGLLQLLY